MYNYTVGEHTQLNSPIGEPVIATDPDVGQTLKHMILAVEPSDIPISSFDVATNGCAAVSGPIIQSAPVINIFHIITTISNHQYLYIYENSKNKLNTMKVNKHE